MSLNPTELQQVRSTPLFAGLTDTQLGCLEPGEVIAAPPGTVLASEGERTGLFQVLLEGEVRITRICNRPPTKSKLFSAISARLWPGNIGRSCSTPPRKLRSGQLPCLTIWRAVTLPIPSPTGLRPTASLVPGTSPPPSSMPDWIPS